MDTTTEKAYAKLNLSLDILCKRDDDYHEMCMVMQTVDFGDYLNLSLRRDGEIKVTTNLRYIPCDDNNIAVKAARAFFAEMGDNSRGVNIDIKKRIPVCAGMGGGSADGAAVFRALNRLMGKPFTHKELEILGAKIGSDIPFCISGGTALATGRGEELRALTPMPNCHIVICKPAFSVSTPALFSRVDCSRTKFHPDTDGIIHCLDKSDLRGLGQRMYNVFEDVLPSGRDDVTKIKGILIDSGAYGAVMTGTGSSVFGIFSEQSHVQNAQRELEKRYKEVFITKPV